MQEERYPIPPDLTAGKYIGGYLWLELAVIAISALLAIVSFNHHLPTAVPFTVVAVALAIGLRRSDHGAGFVAPARSLGIMLWFVLAEAAGRMEYRLSQEISHDTREEKHDEETEK